MSNLSYDSDADAAYLDLKDSLSVDSDEVAPGIIVDYGINDEIVGIEILSVSKRTLEELKNIDYLLNPENQQEMSDLFKNIAV